MTDLIQVLPDLDTQSYSHILPSLEKALISTNDLITLDAVDVAKRARVPVNEVRRLSGQILNGLHAQLGVGGDQESSQHVSSKERGQNAALNEWRTISTLDESLDAALYGGFPAGYLSEITGER